MTCIKTTDRLICVEDSIHQVVTDIVENDWIAVTEVSSLYEPWSEEEHQHRRNIVLNKNHIVEIYKDE